jgi:hypothetical protein
MNNYLKRFLLVAVVAAFSVPASFSAADSTKLTLVNKTKFNLTAVLWQGNDSPHMNHNGPEWQAGALAPNGRATAAVPSCKFSLVFWNDHDLWHYEIHDCTSATLTINGVSDDAHVTLK